jgi:hypothetical protein
MTKPTIGVSLNRRNVLLTGTTLAAASALGAATSVRVAQASEFNTKRTSRHAQPMSAFDPKRTSIRFLMIVQAIPKSTLEELNVKIRCLPERCALLRPS